LKGNACFARSDGLVAEQSTTKDGISANLELTQQYQLLSTTVWVNTVSE
jgi:hypothetical protein